LPARC